MSSAAPLCSRPTVVEPRKQESWVYDLTLEAFTQIPATDSVLCGRANFETRLAVPRIQKSLDVRDTESYVNGLALVLNELAASRRFGWFWIIPGSPRGSTSASRSRPSMAFEPWYWSRVFHTWWYAMSHGERLQEQFAVGQPRPRQLIPICTAPLTNEKWSSAIPTLRDDTLSTMRIVEPGDRHGTMLTSMIQGKFCVGWATEFHSLDGDLPTKALKWRNRGAHTDWYQVYGEIVRLCYSATGMTAMDNLSWLEGVQDVAPFGDTHG